MCSIFTPLSFLTKSAVLAAIQARAYESTTEYDYDMFTVGGGSGGVSDTYALFVCVYHGSQAVECAVPCAATMWASRQYTCRSELPGCPADLGRRLRVQSFRLGTFRLNRQVA